MTIDQHQNPFEIAQRQLDEAARYLELDRATHDLLRTPMHELKVSIRSAWMTVRPKFSRDFAFNITTHVAHSKAVCAGTQLRPSTLFARSPLG